MICLRFQNKFIPSPILGNYSYKFINCISDTQVFDSDGAEFYYLASLIFLQFLYFSSDIFKIQLQCTSNPKPTVDDNVCLKCSSSG